MKKLWPFRNSANFTLSVIGVTAVGLMLFSARNERVFSKSPVVNQAMKILGVNDSIRSLIGNPIMYSGSFSNSYTIQEKQQYYNFAVKGSKSSTNIQLISTKMKIADINERIRKSMLISSQISQKQKQHLSLIQQSKKLRKKQQRLKNMEKVANLQSQIKKLKLQFAEAQKSRIDCLRKFYIPNDQLYQKVVRNKSPEILIPQDQYLYGIQGLVANLPNKTIINVIPPDKVQQQGKQIGYLSKFQSQKYPIRQISEGYLKERVNQGLDGLSEQQIQSYSKHKTNMMYGKYNGYRLVITGMLAIGIASLFFYFHKYRVRPIVGTLIAYQAEKIFSHNPKAIQILKKMKNSKNQLKFGKVYLGGKKGNNFQCEVDVQGHPGAKVSFQGVHQSNGNIKFNKLLLQYKKGSQSKKVDLLV